jgi:FtsP/CotA-like multicopper oxidase with cupredoxin domain
MADMGMDHGMQMPGMNMGGADVTPAMPAAPALTAKPSDMGGMDMSKMSPAEMERHKAMGHAMPAAPPASPAAPPVSHDHTPGMQMPTDNTVPTTNADGVDVASLRGKPSVDNIAMETRNRLGEAGDGLEGNGRRVLTYRDLRALAPHTGAWPTRAIEFHLTGNMERWIWGFNGKKFSEADAIRVKLGERIRFVLVNDTMMEHPIHLHGYLFEVENGRGDRLPLKHTINVKPAERMSFVFTADAPGHWAFHCHLLYHMEMGMFRTVLVS